MSEHDLRWLLNHPTPEVTSALQRLHPNDRRALLTFAEGWSIRETARRPWSKEQAHLVRRAEQRLLEVINDTKYEGSQPQETGAQFSAQMSL